MFDYPAFAALIRQKRSEKRWSQENFAEAAFGNPARKSEISKFENGRKQPNETTIRALCTALDISTAEMAPIRTGGATAKQLDQIPTLSRKDLELLAYHFEIPGAVDMRDEDLRGLLEDKAKEYRALRQQIATLPENIAEILKIKQAAQQAADALDFERVEDLLTIADIADTAAAAQTKMTRANNALLRNRPEQAFDIYCAIADSFRSADPAAPAQIRTQLYKPLWDHGLRYGGPGLQLAERMLQDATALLPENADPRLRAAITTEIAGAQQLQAIRLAGPAGADMLGRAVATYRDFLDREDSGTDASLWAATQNNLGIALRNQGTRTAGAEGTDLLAQAVAAYREALTVFTRDDHPVDWAMTQNNLGAALQDQGSRTAGAKGTELLAQAVAAYREALTVYTPEDHPVQWAMTRENLAIAEQTIADHPGTTDPAPHLRAALDHVEAALQVYDPEHMSYDHGTATELRDDLLARLDAL